MSTVRVVTSLFACALLLGGCGEKQGQFTYTLDEGQPKDAVAAQAPQGSEAAATGGSAATAASKPVDAAVAGVTSVSAAPGAGAIPPSGDPAARKDPAFHLPADAALTTTASGLKHLVVRQGSGAQPKANSSVTVHYIGWLTDGTRFDSSYERGEEISFPLNRVIGGWTEGLQLMQPGGESIFVIPAELGYGAMGSPPVIPPNATLVFRVELLSVSG